MARVNLDSKVIEKLRKVSSTLSIDTKSVPDIIEKLCDKALELSNLVIKLSLVSKRTTLKEFLKELFYLEKLLTNKEKIMFEIYRESYNIHTISLKSIIKRLSWQKLCTTQEAKTLVDKLEEQGLILKIKKCPQCGTPFYYLPDVCENCGHIFILQKVNFKDKRFRPRFAIEITESGKSYVNELITSYIYMYAFFNSWNRYIGQKKSFKLFLISSDEYKCTK